MKVARIGMFCALGLALAAPAGYAQRRESRDDDGDGRLSRQEWRGGSRAFDRLDRDGSGYLERDELPAGLRRRMDARYGNADRRRADDRYGSAGRQRMNDRNSTLDRNGSGVVEGYEWPYNSSLFHKLDRDGNSVLSRDELQQMSAATLGELDRNRDGRIESSEWPGGFAQFEELDTNRDGSISSQEYFERGAEWQRRQRFQAWDKNHDGYISANEWQSAADLFHRLDRDGDTRVSWQEYMGSTERYDRPFGWSQGNADRYRR